MISVPPVSAKRMDFAPPFPGLVFYIGFWAALPLPVLIPGLTTICACLLQPLFYFSFLYRLENLHPIHPSIRNAAVHGPPAALKPDIPQKRKSPKLL